MGQKNLVPTNFGPRKLWHPKIGSVQNWISNSCDIPDMDKCCLGKCCMDKYYSDSWNLFKIVPRTYFSSLVKIGSVTAEIFLIWTNVARTNFALTNITVTVGLCERWSKEPTFKVWSKSVSNNWDIPYMDKCRQDKCCLDKCPSDRWHLLKMVQGTYL